MATRVLVGVCCTGHAVERYRERCDPSASAPDVQRIIDGGKWVRRWRHFPPEENPDGWIVVGRGAFALSRSPDAPDRLVAATFLA